jgi:hypothetical protein
MMNIKNEVLRSHKIPLGQTNLGRCKISGRRTSRFHGLQAFKDDYPDSTLERFITTIHWHWTQPASLGSRTQPCIVMSFYHHFGWWTQNCPSTSSKAEYDEYRTKFYDPTAKITPLGKQTWD